MDELTPPPGGALPASVRRLFVFGCFFSTGVFGLVYEVIWARYLSLLIGNTAQAHAIVLATFMGGLSLGAFVFGRWADRLNNGFRAYGWIEAAVGLYAVFFPSVFGVYEQVFGRLATGVVPGTTAMTALKLVLAALCIVPPTVLMGGTLPVLTRHLTRSHERLRGAVSALYAVNSGGAALGGLLAGFVFLYRLGLPGTITVVGIANVALGLAVVLLGRRAAEDDAPAASVANKTPTVFVNPGTDPHADQDSIVYRLSTRRAAVLLAGLSGFGTMALEVAWIRYFALILGSADYAFTLMLSAFITGITLGAWWLRSERRAHTPLLPLLYAALIGTAAFLALTLPFYDRLPFWLWKVRLIFRPAPESIGYYQLATYLSCFVWMVMPTLVAGVVFPATIRLAGERKALGARLGRVYAVNTLGTLAGALFTTLVLFGAIGTENIFRLVLVLYALGAAAVALMFPAAMRNRLIGVALGLVALHVLLYRPMDPRALNMGLYRMTQKPDITYADFEKSYRGDDLVFYQEGPYGSVAVRRRPVNGLLGKPILSLTVNGKADAGTDVDMYMQLMLGHLPMLFLDKPTDVFVVGLGSGVTAGALLTHDVHVDLAEISPEVVAAERLFREDNRAPLQDGRLTLYVEDARTVLRLGSRQYDAVVSEPTNPWQSGVASLFSIDFYTVVKQRLKPGGILAQWMHAYQADDETFRIVMATLRQAFRYTTLFETAPGDYIFLASDRPVVGADPAVLEARMSRPETREDLARIGGDRVAVLLSTQTAGSRAIDEAARDGRIHSDDLPVLEEAAQRGFLTQQTAGIVRQLDQRSSGGVDLALRPYLAKHPWDADDLRALARFYTHQPASQSKRLAIARAIRAADAASDPALAAFITKTIEANPGALPFVLQDELFAGSLATPAGDIAPILDVATAVYVREFWSWSPPPTRGLEDLADRLHATGGDDIPARLRLTEAFCRLGVSDACRRQIDRLKQRAAAITASNGDSAGAALAAPAWYPFLFKAAFDDALARDDLDAAAVNLREYSTRNAADYETIWDMERDLRDEQALAADR